MIALTLHDEYVLQRYKDGKLTRGQVLYWLKYLDKEDKEFVIKMIDEGNNIEDFAVVKRQE
jgi:hypothetical protein